jgi:hypothetical protein
MNFALELELGPGERQASLFPLPSSGTWSKSIFGLLTPRNSREMVENKEDAALTPQHVEPRP